MTRTTLSLSAVFATALLTSACAAPQNSTATTQPLSISFATPHARHITQHDYSELELQDVYNSLTSQQQEFIELLRHQNACETEIWNNNAGLILNNIETYTEIDILQETTEDFIFSTVQDSCTQAIFSEYNGSHVYELTQLYLAYHYNIIDTLSHQSPIIDGDYSRAETIFYESFGLHVAMGFHETRTESDNRYDL